MVDYSLCLITDVGCRSFRHRDYDKLLEESLQAGVTLVEVGGRNVDAAEFLEAAQRSSEICKRYNVPIIIRGNIDIALAIGADGVHLEQTDTPIEVARQLLPKDSIIGLSCISLDHVQNAIQQGADYVTIGTLYYRDDKLLIPSPLTVRSVSALLQALDGTNIKAVAIGGINPENALRILHGTVSSTNHPFDGLMFCITASSDPGVTAERLGTIIADFRAGPSIQQGLGGNELGTETIVSKAASLLSQVRSSQPVVNQITSLAAVNQSASVTLALGASFMKISSVNEMEDVAKRNEALLVNIGSVCAESKPAMLQAGFWNNVARKPIVFDPVGIKDNAFRHQAAQELLDLWAPSVIKGNADELAALGAPDDAQATHVEDPVSFVRQLAIREHCVVVLTGAVDYVSDGVHVVACKNGDKLLDDISAVRCASGSIITLFCAAASLLATKKCPGTLVDGDIFVATIAGILAMTIAAEHAAKISKAHGPEALSHSLIDSLSNLTAEDISREARIEIVL